MSRTLATLIALFLVATAGAARAVPTTVGFTGRLTHADGTPVTGTVAVSFALYATPSGGAAVWTESRPALAASPTGVITADLGAITAFGGAFDGDRWLEITVAGEVLQPRLTLHSVPFALRAGDADTVGGLDPADLGDITGVSAGPGLTGGAVAGDAALAVDFAQAQHRVTGTCPGGAISAIDAAGAVTCQPPAGDITGVTAGTGLTGGGTTGAITMGVDFAATQARVAGACAAGSSIRAIATTGTVTCEPDDDSGADITSVTAGTGLTGGGTTGAVTVGLRAPVSYTVSAPTPTPVATTAPIGTAFCALTRVQILVGSDPGTNRWCAITGSATEGWTLTARGGNTQATTCDMLCF